MISIKIKITTTILVLISLFLVSCSGVKEMTSEESYSSLVSNGDTVKVEYEGSLDDGTVFDSSIESGNPLEFIVGQGQLIPGFENAVRGMKKDETKEFTLEPEQAYGYPKQELVEEIPREQLEGEVSLEEGLQIVLNGPGGNQMPAIIEKLTEETVTLDLNHPLAGERLHFKIKVLGIN